ncbi:MAG: bifunctional serine/threonine-protein kinase/formylglycine-generating enzyme family protein [Verrucomicrobiota bacterium]
MNPDAVPHTRCAVCEAPLENPAEWLGMCPACWGQAGLQAAASMARETATLHVEGFRIIRRIARGGMGTVYEAVRGADDQRVALKVLREDLADQPRFLEMFRRECEAMARLDHPHVVKHLGAGETDGLPFLAMEYIEGPNLQQVLRKGPLPVDRALEIVGQVCAALEAAHAQRLIHRDIKPANVLLDEEGRVKVTDFGLARLPRPAGEASLTGSLLALGGHYAAPELERGDPAADHRGDLYSTGALLYHLVTGEPPRAHAEPVHRLRSGHGVTLGLQRIITRALQPEACGRFASAREMRLQVVREQRFLRNWPLFARRQAQLVLYGTLLAVVASGCLLGWSMAQESPEEVAAALKERAEMEARLAVEERLAPVPAGWKPQQHQNSLGMKFVSIPDLDGVLVSIWETRVGDYAAFNKAQADAGWIKDTGYQRKLSRAFHGLKKGEFVETRGSWRSPGFRQTDEHPVCGTSLFEAQAFCTWLTWKERSSGAIRASQAYRLPTDAEWSTAAGLKPEPGATPEEKGASWKVRMHAFPWGHEWPAPDGLYNIVDSSVVDEDWHPNWIFKPRRDPWPRTAPVNAVPPSPLGLYHMVGNVAEITESLINDDPSLRLHAIRGGAWFDGSREGVSLATRARDSAGMRIDKRGFRIVFVTRGGEGWRYVGK